MDRPMLIRKSELQPVLKKTERGGRKRARKYRQMSPVEEGMMMCVAWIWWCGIYLGGVRLSVGFV